MCLAPGWQDTIVAPDRESALVKGTPRCEGKHDSIAILVGTAQIPTKYSKHPRKTMLSRAATWHACMRRQFGAVYNVVVYQVGSASLARLRSRIRKKTKTSSASTVDVLLCDLERGAHRAKPMVSRLRVA